MKLAAWRKFASVRRASSRVIMPAANHGSLNPGTAIGLRVHLTHLAIDPPPSPSLRFVDGDMP
jgi:hypothetical protein